MFSKIKAFFHVLTQTVENQERLEKAMILLERRVMLMENKNDRLFDDAVAFMHKQNAERARQAEAKSHE